MSPASLAGCAVRSSAGRLPPSRPVRLTEYCTCPSAVLRSGETDLDVSGFTTAVTCGAWAASAMVALMAAAYCGSVTRCPAGATKTSCALVPDAAGKDPAMLSRACWDWEPGMVNSLSVEPPKANTQAATAARTVSQAASTARR